MQSFAQGASKELARRKERKNQVAQSYIAIRQNELMRQQKDKTGVQVYGGADLGG